MSVESFSNLEGGARVTATIAMVVALTLTPWLSARLLSIARRSKAEKQRRIWIFQEILLAVSVGLTFAATAATFQVSAAFISPWIWDIPTAPDLDAPLTTRNLFAWCTVVALGWSVFRWAGLNSIRDVHRGAKESMDLVSRHRQQSK